MKKTFKEIGGTSFHNITITTTVNELIRVIGEPHYSGNDGEGKINFEWECETENGDVVTIYDWKEYRVLDLNEEINFHLGSYKKEHTLKAKEELELYLNK